MSNYQPFKPRKRFYIDGYYHNEKKRFQLVDAMCGQTVGAQSFADAKDMATFARAYVKKHGDIDLGSFPYHISEALTYDSLTDERDWYFIDGKQVVNGCLLPN